MNCLTWFENWMLRKIIKKMAILHNQDSLFDIIYETNAEVFHEDNHHTHIANMREEVNLCSAYQLMKLSRKS